MSPATDTVLGTLSQVGKLRTVMVHRPDLAHERLSPSNCHELEAREWLLSPRVRPEDATQMFAEPLKEWPRRRDRL